MFKDAGCYLADIAHDSVRSFAETVTAEEALILAIVFLAERVLNQNW